MDREIEYKSDIPRRLDLFAKQSFPHIPRSQILELIKKGRVFVNKASAAKGFKLQKGDVVSFKGFPSIKEIRISPNSKLRLEIIYEDRWLIAADKPKGMPTHPNRHTETDTLANALVAAFPELQGVGDKKLEPGLLNRLDNDTSGIVLAAKSNEAFRAFKALLAKKETDKQYFALVSGMPKSKGMVDAPLIHDRKNRKKMATVKTRSKPGKAYQAVTFYETIERFRDSALIRVRLKTGVMHQIRIHMASIGHPIIGDPIYGPKSECKGGKRVKNGQFLHASKAEFIHPFTGRRTAIESPLPAYFKTELAGKKRET